MHTQTTQGQASLALASPLERILAGDGIDGADILAALQTAIERAEEWLGHDIVLECTAEGWSVRYRSGGSYRHAILDTYRACFRSPEDAIEALVKCTRDARKACVGEELPCPAA